MSTNDSDFRPTYGSCDHISTQCPTEATVYGSLFNLPANVFFAVAFAVTLAAHTWYALRSKLWNFSGWILAATIMELMGYVARSIMHFQPWKIELLSIQICGLLWGPSLTAAGISILFKHIVFHYGPQYSILKPKWIPFVFIGTDLISLNIQGVGGIIAAVATSKPGSAMARAGELMMIIGVCAQVANMLVCGSIMLVFLRRYQRIALQGRGEYGPAPSDPSAAAADSKGPNSDVPLTLRCRSKTKNETRTATIFGWALATSYTAILLRTIYRIVEMAGGWANPVMRSEPSFLVLESAYVEYLFPCLTACRRSSYPCPA